jgi:lipopolysaccharide biosynthesis protein
MMDAMTGSGLAAGDTAQAPVTVFVHVHYPDIWQEMSVILAERVKSPFHLVLTRTRDEVLQAPETPWLLTVTQRRVENRGRDVKPFLQALAEMPGLDIGLKLHAKKSPQRTDGDRWRSAALCSLLPPEGCAAVIASLRADPRIGLVAPSQLSLSVDPWVLGNEAGMVRIMTTLGAELVDSALNDAYFAAGTMFWFRRAAIEALTAPAVLELFEEEENQLDDTIAHAMERIFGVEARRRGFVSMSVSALTEASSSSTTAELLGLARRYADLPSDYFPSSRMSVPSSDSSAAAMRWARRLGWLLRRR